MFLRICLVELTSLIENAFTSTSVESQMDSFGYVIHMAVIAFLEAVNLLKPRRIIAGSGCSLYVYTYQQTFSLTYSLQCSKKESFSFSFSIYYNIVINNVPTRFEATPPRAGVHELWKICPSIEFLPKLVKVLLVIVIN